MPTVGKDDHCNQLEETFAFIEQVGRGAFSTAWLAIDRRSQERVLVKALPKACSTRDSFKRELKYAVYLSSHENIINTYPLAYESDAHFILVSEYGSGGDLFNAIRTDVGMSQVLVRRYISQLASALNYMHTRRLVHRDIKPENTVLVPAAKGKRYIIKLIDFGLTRREGTKIPQPPSTSPYSAPELCVAKKTSRGYVVRAALDSWALGITLFSMLTGRFPWERASRKHEEFAQFDDWQSGRRTSVPHHWRCFSPQLLLLFTKLLSVEPATRGARAVNEVQAYVHVPWFKNSLDDNGESHATRQEREQRETTTSAEPPTFSCLPPTCR